MWVLCFTDKVLLSSKLQVGDSVVVEKGRDANSRREKHAAALQTKSGDQLVDKYWYVSSCHSGLGGAMKFFF